MSTRKNNPFHDPQREREAATYEHPVPSREAVLELLKAENRPLSFDEIAQALHVEGERDLDAFSRRLRAMARDGQLLQNRRGLFGLAQKMDLIPGRLSGHPDGFGFLIPDDGGDDLFVNARDMRQALHNDRVLVRVTGLDHKGRREASIAEVLERANATVVGRFAVSQNTGFVIPEDRRISLDIVVGPNESLNAKPGQIVLAEITAQPTARTGPVGRVVEILGDYLAPGMEIEVALRKHNLPYVWPTEVEREAAAIGAEVPAEAKKDRADLRRTPLLTIDGEDARDFDDAVFAERHDKGWRLLVAIADVSAYVKPGSALDKEAVARGNSVYFPRRVIPMLPEALSNGLCSINPAVDRLCLVCEAHVDATGKIKNYKFFEAVMSSHARLTYTKVAAILVQRDSALRREYAAVLPHLEELHALFKVLHEERLKRGAVDFELPETKILFDEHSKIKKIVPVERNDAHRLIEECMLVANVCAAQYLQKHKVPAPYRIHEGPTQEKLKDLREFLFELGLSLGGADRPKAKDYSKLIHAVEARPDSKLIQTVLLRSLSQAMYSPDNIGHFALGYEQYTHFTSPIRRYPDLVVHREIKNILCQRPASLTQDAATKLGLQCSTTERRADEATREVVKWLKCEYMNDRIGEEFDGIISGVTNFGLFVELSEVYVDGLVHITSLGNDYYHFDPGKHRLTGERTRTVFRLGDKVRVKLMRVNLEETKIDFELVSSQSSSAAAPARDARNGPRKKFKKPPKRKRK